jgi:hypothetical protein
MKMSFSKKIISFGAWKVLKEISNTSAAVEFSNLIVTTYIQISNVLYSNIRSLVSSDSIVSDYGLDDRAIGIRSPTGAKDFSSILCVQAGSGAHPASFPMGTGGPFPGGKARPGRDADHSPPSSAEVVNE